MSQGLDRAVPPQAAIRADLAVVLRLKVPAKLQRKLDDHRDEEEGPERLQRRGRDDRGAGNRGPGKQGHRIAGEHTSRISIETQEGGQCAKQREEKKQAFLRAREE